MANGIKLDWFGDAKKADMKEAMVKFLIRGTNIVQSDAKLLVPKDTTDLMGSIVKNVDNSTLIGSVSTNSEYAVYVEFGTGRYAENGNGRKTPWFYEDANGVGHWTAGMRPQPYMRPALNNNKEKLIKIAKEEVKNGVNK